MIFFISEASPKFVMPPELVSTGMQRITLKFKEKYHTSSRKGQDSRGKEFDSIERQERLAHQSHYMLPFF